MVALQDGQTPNAFSGSSKSHKNRKGLVVLPPEEVKLFPAMLQYHWFQCMATYLLHVLAPCQDLSCQIVGTCQGHC